MDQNLISGLEPHDDIGLCVKNADRVIVQNESCSLFCGPQEGDICTKCDDKAILLADGAETKIRYKIFDKKIRLLIHYKKGPKETTIHVPVESETVKTIFTFFQQTDVTAQEREILKLICEGYANEEIVDILCIAMSTLKTHINHLNQKLPNVVSFRKKIGGFLKKVLPERARCQSLYAESARVKPGSHSEGAR